ncbi:hypothetical protein EZS27_020737 [termite gut metagenome]|uniref:FunZ protein n=1 Tax=termite gut metagenome TaxID=433724 RepID=A0A5J4RAI4_9ZZZZ
MTNTFLKEITDNWNREARREDIGRYFYFYKEVNQIAQGKKSYVIGRKGSGKTAMSEYLFNMNNENNVFSKRLSFADFPYQQLYGLNDNRYAKKSEYITIWKYIIYSSVCELMLANSRVNEDVRHLLAGTYQKDVLTELPRKVEKWTSSNFIIPNITNTDVDIISWTQKIYLQEDILKEYIDNSTYFILIDGLDDDYTANYRNDPDQFTQYNNVITSLFKAIHSIKESFIGKNTKIYPVLFLRDDIFKNIRDNDRTKWGDLSIEIDWDRDKIRKMLAFRITRVFDPDTQKALPFNEAWLKLFSKYYVEYGNKQSKQMHSYDFIDRMTQLRPRDYIEYIRACCSRAYLKGASQVSPDIVRSEEKAFSNYLRSETIDEVFPVLPEIETIFTILSEVSTTNSFSIDSFKEAFNNYVQRKELNEANVDYVLQVLFDFNIIGNLPKPNFSVFRYKNKEAKLNRKEKLIVNRGLFKSLQIV